MPARSRRAQSLDEATPSASALHDAPAQTSQQSLFNKTEIDLLRTSLIGWFRRGHRDMPWRKLADPYAIWISEIMLQQTRVDTVRSYFQRFMASFPTIQALAAAPQEQVLALWSGLGYYARARNLHAAAQQVVQRHGGIFPSDPEAVQELRGIGPYTAGAILSIAFGQRAPLLDGNVIRVLSRLRALSEPAETTVGKRLFWSLAAELVPPPRAKREVNDPGDFNQALMELGATVCLPQRPVCLVCPVASLCRARQLGQVEHYPPAKKAKSVPVVQVLVLVVRAQGQLLLLRRPPLGLWGGLWEPPTLNLELGESPREALPRLLRERLNLRPEVLPSVAELPAFVHLLTHREMHFAPFLLDWSGVLPSLRLSGYEEARLVDPQQPLALGLSAWVSTLLRRVA